MRARYPRRPWLENIVKLSVLAMATFFNSTAVPCVARCVQGDEVDVIIDCSDLKRLRSTRGRGVFAASTRSRGGRAHSRTRNPSSAGRLAWPVTPTQGCHCGSGVAPIHRSDQALFWAVLDEARKNLLGKRIRSVVIDYGFFDGEDLWKLDQMGIEFVIPSRSHMRVHQDAPALAARGGRKGGQHDDVVVDQEDIHLVEGSGKAGKTRQVQTVLVGVSNLTSLDSYGPPGHKDKQNHKDFRPNPVPAVVVRQWRGEAFKEPEVRLPNGTPPVRPLPPLRRPQADRERRLSGGQAGWVCRAASPEERSWCDGARVHDPGRHGPGALLPPGDGPRLRHIPRAGDGDVERPQAQDAVLGHRNAGR